MTDVACLPISVPLRVAPGRAAGLFIVFWAALSGYYLYLGAMDALLLWVILPVVFGAVLFTAWRSGHVVLTFFMVAIFLSHGVLPSIFFTQKERFTRTGWLAVKDFDFDVVQFLNIYLPVMFYVAAVLFGTLFLRRLKLRRRDPQDSTRRPSRLVPSADEMCPVPLGFGHLGSAGSIGRSRQGKQGYGILLVLVIMLAALVNNWMYSHGIAMTGLIGGQAQLPFRLGGLLYYSTKFLLPVLLFFVYRRTTRPAALAFLLSLYALWAGFSQVSRFTLSVLFLPVLAVSYLDRRYLRFGIALLVFLLAYHWVSQARSSIYVFSDGVISRDVSLSLMRLTWQTIRDNAFVSPIDPLFAVVRRMEGGQDVVLASQYDTAAMGGSLREFQRVFLFGANVTGRQVVQALYGFVPPRGFSPGLGGFSSRILQIAGGNPLILVPLALWVSMLLAVGERLRRSYAELFSSREIGYLIGGIYVILLYIFGQPSWLYAFLVLGCMGLFVHDTTCLAKCGQRPCREE